MTDTDIIETRGDYRVRIETMDHAEPPDWDGQGTVIQLDSDRSYVMHRTCDDFDLATLWRYWGYYGEQDATEEARKAFSDYVSDTEGSVPA